MLKVFTDVYHLTVNVLVSLYTIICAPWHTPYWQWRMYANDVYKCTANSFDNNKTQKKEIQSSLELCHKSILAFYIRLTQKFRECLILPLELVVIKVIIKIVVKKCMHS